MQLPVWGNLAKSQTDAEKIEEAIVRLITEHNDDETAHLGAGQSLQSHKAAEIIDHLAESIVEDKIGDGEVSSRCITTDQIVGKDFRTDIDVGEDVDGIKFDSDGIEMWQNGDKKVNIPVTGNPTFKGDIFANGLYFLKRFIYTSFESIDSWYQKTAANIQNTLGSLYVGVGGVSGTINGVESEPLGGSEIDFNNKNPGFQIFLKAGYATSQTIYFGIGVSATDLEHHGFGFNFQNGNVRCFIGSDTYVLSHHTVAGYSPNVYHEYRAVMTSGEKIDFYIDGVLVYTWNYSMGSFPNGTDPRQFGIYVCTDEDAIKYVNAQYLAIMQDR